MRTDMSNMFWLFLFLIAPIAHAAERAKPVGNALMWPAKEISRVMSAVEPMQLVRIARDWQDAPTYQKLAFVEAMVEYIRKSDRVVNTSPAPGNSHDLNYVAGRAAWAIQEVIGVSMPLVTSESMKNPQLLFKQSSAIVEAYRSGIMEVSRQARSRRSLDELKGAYAGKVHIGISDKAYESAAALTSLFEEWSPLGKRLSDLSKILGVEGETVGNDRVYRFDTGFAGVEYRLVIKEGIITSVVTLGLE